MPRPNPEITLLTPDMAAELLNCNMLNRPLNDQHVQRIARQIIDKKWKFNGDTIKISTESDILDGQHRLWAVMEAKIAIETVIVRGIERDAFATIDTLRKPRSGADVIALSGTMRNRQVIAPALGWLVRWQRGVLENYRAPQHRVENSDIESAFAAHPAMAAAAETGIKLRKVGNPAIIAFAYYVMSNQNAQIAEDFIKILRDPAGVGLTHPFFMLRAYFLGDKLTHKDPVVSIALVFKAANAVKENKEIQLLHWRNQGTRAEDFPTLKIGQGTLKPGKSSDSHETQGTRILKEIALRPTTSRKLEARLQIKNASAVLNRLKKNNLVRHDAMTGIWHAL
jgi:hypothetical protein